MNNARILVVDDESNIRELLEEILSEEGYEVTTARRCCECARARAAKQDFDLTFSTSGCPIPTASRCSANGPRKELAGSRRDDVGSWNRRYRCRGHSARRARLYREARVSRDLLKTVERALGARRPVAEQRRTLVPPMRVPVGKSETIRELREQRRAHRQARYTRRLFTGEPGSGREAFRAFPRIA